MRTAIRTAIWTAITFEDHDSIDDCVRNPLRRCVALEEILELREGDRPEIARARAELEQRARRGALSLLNR